MLRSTYLDLQFRHIGGQSAHNDFAFSSVWQGDDRSRVSATADNLGSPGALRDTSDRCCSWLASAARVDRTAARSALAFDKVFKRHIELARHDDEGLLVDGRCIYE